VAVARHGSIRGKESLSEQFIPQSIGNVYLEQVYEFRRVLWAASAHDHGHHGRMAERELQRSSLDRHPVPLADILDTAGTRYQLLIVAGAVLKHAAWLRVRDEPAVKDATHKYRDPAALRHRQQFSQSLMVEN